MGETQQIASQKDLPDEKLVGNYIGVHKLLEPLFFAVNDAEVRSELLGQYLQVIFDELATISRRYIDETGRKSLLQEWDGLEERYGPLASKRFLLSAEEWGERKRAMIAMRENLGMGTTAPSSSRNLATPLRMAEYHRCCAKNCPKAKELKLSHRRFQ